MSYLDERVNFLVDDLGGSILTAIEENGLDNYIEAVRTAVSDYRQEIAAIIRESYRNGLAAGRKRALAKLAPSERAFRPKAAQPTR